MTAAFPAVIDRRYSSLLCVFVSRLFTEAVSCLAKKERPSAVRQRPPAEEKSMSRDEDELEDVNQSPDDLDLDFGEGDASEPPMEYPSAEPEPPEPPPSPDRPKAKPKPKPKPKKKATKPASKPAARKTAKKKAKPKK